MKENEFQVMHIMFLVFNLHNILYATFSRKPMKICCLYPEKKNNTQATVGTRQPRAIEVHQDKGQSKVPCHCLPGGHIQDHWGVFTVVPGHEGLRVVPHLPCTRQPVSFRSTYCSTL